MKSEEADEIVLETEITNIAALKLYESFGFIREKRLLTYYLNGNDAYKLKLYIKS
jgi:N-alpha-acetyltransferase 30